MLSVSNEIQCKKWSAGSGQHLWEDIVLLCAFIYVKIHLNPKLSHGQTLKFNMVTWSI